ncbi:carbohydrate-binding protein, partial [Puniceicoccaceae bacterium K14]|nr:carbohydrate-binding protein [Puniceicoccaceae bacterium K14]
GPVTDNGSDNVICDDIEECGDANCGGADPFSAVEAEDSCDNSGVQFEDTADEGGGLNAGWINSDDWLRFDAIDFGRGAVAFDIRVATNNAGGDIELRLGSETGALVGIAPVVTTGGWQNWETVSIDLLEEVEGVHDLFLVFRGEGGSSLFNVNWFTFARSADNVNLALDGVATQSSIDFEGEPSRGIDGNKSGLWEDSSVTHTATELNSWWEVDLESVQSIGDIVVYPRTDACCTHRFSLITVSVLDADRNEVFTRSYTKEKSFAFIVAARGVDGQIVRIQLDDENPLSLAEVEVYPYFDVDSDEDGMLDSVDPNDDNDDYADEDDLFPTDPTEWSDVDEDGIGDNSDTDNDNDGVGDDADAFPLDSSEWLDTDSDGTGNNADTDDDGDGYSDIEDIFPLDPSEWADSDVDGVGDNSEVAAIPINLSTRGYVLEGDKVMIAGFVVEGTDPVVVLIQGVGPELGEDTFDGYDTMTDPSIVLYDADGNIIGENDDWQSDDVAAISDASVIVGSYSLEAGSKSSAILTNLDPGAYTVILRSVDAQSSVALVEVYSIPDLD